MDSTNGNGHSPRHEHLAEQVHEVSDPMSGRGVKYTILCGMLQIAVPLRIMNLQERGGPVIGDWVQAQLSVALLMAPGGTQDLMGDGGNGEAAKMFNMLAQALAVLAFTKGGVTAFGGHWEHKAG